MYSKLSCLEDIYVYIPHTHTHTLTHTHTHTWHGFVELFPADDTYIDVAPQSVGPIKNYQFYFYL